MDRVEEIVNGALVEGVFVRGSLTGPRQPGAALRRVVLRPVVIRGRPFCQLELHEKDRVTHENLTPDAAAVRIAGLMSREFREADLATTTHRYRIMSNRRGELTVRERADAGAVPDRAHNRSKRYLIPEGEPCAFLERLGVMTSAGRVVESRYAKFRQVNRFLEIVADAAGGLDLSHGVRMVDFGCGRSYLTFALYHYFREIRSTDVEILGLDRKPGMIEECRAIARDLGCEGMRFEVGEIAGREAGGPIDLVVALHACDTATDDALAQAVAWDAAVILAAPCCQHELLGRIDSREMRPMLRHGVVKERLAALVTDALRAQLLELHGYSVRIMEFIETEHTPKNLLIRAVRAPGRRFSAEAVEEYRVFRDFWSARPALERALGAPSSRSPDPDGASPAPDLGAAAAAEPRHTERPQGDAAPPENGRA